MPRQLAAAVQRFDDEALKALNQVVLIRYRNILRGLTIWTVLFHRQSRGLPRFPAADERPRFAPSCFL